MHNVCLKTLSASSFKQQCTPAEFTAWLDSFPIEDVPQTRPQAIGKLQETQHRMSQMTKEEKLREYYSLAADARRMNYLNNNLRKSLEFREFISGFVAQKCIALHGFCPLLRDVFRSQSDAKCVCFTATRLAELANEEWNDTGLPQKKKRGEEDDGGAEIAVAAKLSAAEVRREVDRSNNYINMKRIMKHKAYREPSEGSHLAYKFGEHLDKLLTRQEDVPNRQQNSIIISRAADTGKTTINESIVSITAGPHHEHLCMRVSNQRQGMTSYLGFNSYCVSTANDLSFRTLDGAQMKSYLESDGASVDQKNTVSKMQRRHTPYFCSANEWKNDCNNLKSNWTSDEYEKCFASKGGRCGLVVRTELPVPEVFKKSYHTKCSRCSYRFIKWLVQVYRSDRRFITDTEIVPDSDEEEVEPVAPSEPLETHLRAGLRAKPNEGDGQLHHVLVTDAELKLLSKKVYPDGQDTTFHTTSHTHLRKD